MAQRILVVDDDREIVRLVRTYLEQSRYEVLTAYDGETALHILRRERPDLMLLDLMLPSRDARACSTAEGSAGGLDVTRVVRSDTGLAAMPIIMLTARVQDHDKILGLEMGADDYVSKPFNPHEVVARVRAVLRRAQMGDAQGAAARVIQVGDLCIDLDRHQVLLHGQEANLTPTEFDLLRALAEHPGRALTRQEMIEKGLGYSYEGLDRTVDSHVKNLRKKLEDAGGSAQLIETVFGVGYRLAPGDAR